MTSQKSRRVLSPTQTSSFIPCPKAHKGKQHRQDGSSDTRLSEGLHRHHPSHCLEQPPLNSRKQHRPSCKSWRCQNGSHQIHSSSGDGCQTQVESLAAGAGAGSCIWPEGGQRLGWFRPGGEGRQAQGDKLGGGSRKCDPGSKWPRPECLEMDGKDASEPLEPRLLYWMSWTRPIRNRLDGRTVSGHDPVDVSSSVEKYRGRCPWKDSWGNIFGTSCYPNARCRSG